MKVKELVNTCTNQWKGMLIKNDQFRIIFNFQNTYQKELYDIKTFNEIQFKKIEERHNQEVIAWWMKNINELEILVETN